MAAIQPVHSPNGAAAYNVVGDDHKSEVKGLDGAYEDPSKGSEVADLIKYKPLSVGVGKGTWWHCGFTMTTAVAGPALLGLPYAMSLMGWAGLAPLIMGFFATLYTSFLIASLHEFDGKRHIRYRDLAEAIYGPYTGRWMVLVCQWANLIGANISIYIQGGLSIQAIYQIAQPGDTTIKLWMWIAIMGGVALFFTQLPTLHSLRWLNACCMVSTYTFTAMAIAISIYQGYHYHPPRDYGVHTNNVNKFFGVCTGIVIMSFAYGNTIIPEIQATAREPSDKTMYGAIKMLYTLLALTYIPMAITGYWAYGYLLNVNVAAYLPAFMSSIGGPNGWIIALNALTVFNAICGIALYNAPVLEAFESRLYNQRESVWSPRNWAIRTVLRTSYVVLLCFFGLLFPYFGDILGLIGALGVTPIDFVYPIAMYLTVRKPRGLKKWANVALMSLYIVVGVLGTISSIRQIVVDAQTYSVFANLGVVTPTGAVGG